MATLVLAPNICSGFVSLLSGTGQLVPSSASSILLCFIWCSYVCGAGAERSVHLTSESGCLPCLVQGTFLKLHMAPSAVSPPREVHFVRIKGHDALVLWEPYGHQAI